MAKIAVIFAQKFEDSEYLQPAEALKRAGHELVHVGGKEGGIVKAEPPGKIFQIDKAVKEVSVHEFDALLIPGGYSPDRLRFDEDEFQFVKAFVESGKFVLGTGRK